jgi:hypothetical protein
MKPRPAIFSAVAPRWLLAALTALVLVSRAPAQPAPEERWLLVFDTSSAMKKRLPAVEAAVKSFLATSGGGQLHDGDTIGVWAFDQQLHTGQFPLTVWTPERAIGTFSNLVAFVRDQHYTGTTAFAALQPMLNRVIENSERLTVIVFCDGQDAMAGTPYDDGINQTFRSSRDERKSLRQPFVLLLRTQRGKFTGSTINFPPGTLNIPPFPPLPEPVKPVPTNVPPPVHVAVKPPPVVPALIIIGTNVSTNPDDLLKPATNEPAKPAVATPETNHPVSNAVVTAKSIPPAAPAKPAANPPELQIKETNRANLPAAQTNVVTTANSGGSGPRGWLMLGAGLFGVAVALVVFLVVRARRRGQGSLITSSMNQDRRPPGRN